MSDLGSRDPNLELEKRRHRVAEIGRRTDRPSHQLRIQRDFGASLFRGCIGKCRVASQNENQSNA